MQSLSPPPSPWLTALALVKFDFDEGQLIQQLYPSSIFTKSQQKSIAMLSFPDSNAFQSNEGITKYIFRIKREERSKGKEKQKKEEGKVLFGFVCFKQKKDGSIFRGYFQKSFVILSQYPMVGFYGMLAEFLVFRLFGDKEKGSEGKEKGEQTKQKQQVKQKMENGKHLQTQFQSLLSQIYHQTLLWPLPQPFLPLTLPLLSYTFTISLPTFLPHHSSLQYKTHKILTLHNLHQTGHYQQTTLLPSLRLHIPLLWPLWQITLLNKPLLIFGENPSQVSNMVLAVISLISPLEYVAIGVDYKPYMTVYDEEFLEIQKRMQGGGEGIGTVIGVTNPLFLKTLKKFPHILSLSPLSSHKNITPHRIQPDPHLFLILTDMHSSKQPDSTLQNLIRRHFRKLTEMFMQQFECYFLQQKNDLKRWKKEEFMKWIKGEKVELGGCGEGKRSVVKLYGEFVETENFGRYLKGRNVVRG